MTKKKKKTIMQKFRDLEVDEFLTFPFTRWFTVQGTKARVMKEDATKKFNIDRISDTQIKITRTS